MNGLNWIEGRALRDEGIARVESSNPGWMQRAVAFARIVRADSLRYGIGSTFTGENIRDVITAHEGPPHHANAWGALIRNLVRQQVIVPTGHFVQMRKASSHARVNPLYRWNRE